MKLKQHLYDSAMQAEISTLAYAPKYLKYFCFFRFSPLSQRDIDFNGLTLEGNVIVDTLPKCL